MTDLQVLATLVIFAGVILAIAFDLLDMVVAALLGVSLVVLFGDLTQEDVIRATWTGSGPLALLFGGMVVARTLKPTGIFENLGVRFLLLTRGSGKRFLLGTLILVVPLCAFLPNATTVILLAPIIIGTARALKVDFVAPMIIVSILSNSAGLLTLVGDPATFLVGSSIGVTFGQYLRQVSPGGLLAVLVVIPLMPLLLGDVWRTRRALPEGLAPEPLERPGFTLLSLAVLAVIVLLYIFGDSLPTHILPPAVSIIGATLALLVIYCAKVEPVDAVIRDIDWKTLVFLSCLFCLVEAVTKTGLLQSLSQNMHDWFDDNLLLVGLTLLAGIALASTVLANIPVVAAMVLVTKGYFVIAELVPEQALGVTYGEWPAASLPVFVAMMFGATLGGNATLVGASANIVSAGICTNEGRPLSFRTFLRYGAPVALCQLLVTAAYVVGMQMLSR